MIPEDYRDDKDDVIYLLKSNKEYNALHTTRMAL